MRGRKRRGRRREEEVKSIEFGSVNRQRNVQEGIGDK